jgi:hypothetical protein
MLGAVKLKGMWLPVWSLQLCFTVCLALTHDCHDWQQQTLKPECV